MTRTSPLVHTSSLRAAALVFAVALMGTACTGATGPGGPSVSARAGSASPTGAAPRLRFAPAGFSLSAPIQREVAIAVAGGPIYLAGGLDAYDRSASGVFALDPHNGRLRQLGNLPQPVHDAAGAMVGGRLMVFGGGSSSSTNLIQSYDPQTRRSSIVGRLPKPLSDLSLAATTNGLFLVGGYDGVSPQRAIYSVSGSMRVRRVGSLPVGLRYAAVSAARGSTLVVAGGVSAAGPVSTVYSFNINTHRISLLGHLHRPLGHASAFALDGRAFVAGGLSAGGRALRSVYEIDAAGVKRLQKMRLPISDAAAAQAGQTAWLLGGWRGQTVAQVLRVTLRSG